MKGFLRSLLGSLLIFAPLIWAADTAQALTPHDVWFGPGNEPDLVEIIAAYPWPVAEALEIVDCESSFNPRAVSPTNDHGLFQHNAKYGPDRFDRAGFDWADRYDPATNTAVAFWLWSQTEDWRHWTCRKTVTGSIVWGVESVNERTVAQLRGVTMRGMKRSGR